MTYDKNALSGVFAILAIVIGAESAGAQAPESRGGYTGFFAAGLSRIATGELDDRLAANGYPAFGSSPGGIALGAYRLLRNGVMLGGEWHYLAVGDDNHNGREVGLGGGYATLGVGYAVELSRRVRVYPRFGLGVRGATPDAHVARPLLSTCPSSGEAVSWAPLACLVKREPV